MVLRINFLVQHTTQIIAILCYLKFENSNAITIKTYVIMIVIFVQDYCTRALTRSIISFEIINCTVRDIFPEEASRRNNTLMEDYK